MSDSGSKQTRIEVPIALMVIGFGIGWLAGLSVSPVVSIVLTAVTGSVATIVAALSGVKEEFLKPDSSSAVMRRLLRSITPVPLAWLVFGLFLGTIAGISVRTHNWLSPDPPPPPITLSLKDEIQQWVDLGLDQQAVVGKYFESRINLPVAVTTIGPASQTHSAKDSVLFATASQEECTAWRSLIDKGRYDDLATEVRSSVVKTFRELPTIVTDTHQLAAIIGGVLCAELQP